jgi:hypothetical protein
MYPIPRGSALRDAGCVVRVGQGVHTVTYVWREERCIGRRGTPECSIHAIVLVLVLASTVVEEVEIGNNKNNTLH